MDWYLWLKFLHLIAVIVWLGGALVMVIIGHVAERSGQDGKLFETMRQVAWCAERVFVPGSLAALLFGVALAWYASLWGELWVVLGLVGIAATLALGIGVLSPKAKKVAHAAEATPAAITTSREILVIAKFDMVLLFTIVADMVLKPQTGDWVLLLVMAIVISAAGYWCFGQLRPRPVATA